MAQHSRVKSAQMFAEALQVGSLVGELRGFRMGISAAGSSLSCTPMADSKQYDDRYNDDKDRYPPSTQVCHPHHKRSITSRSPDPCPVLGLCLAEARRGRVIELAAEWVTCMTCSVHRSPLRVFDRGATSNPQARRHAVDHFSTLVLRVGHMVQIESLRSSESLSNHVALAWKQLTIVATSSLDRQSLAFEESRAEQSSLLSFHLHTLDKQGETSKALGIALHCTTQHITTLHNSAQWNHKHSSQTT
jgi:hypothetical protein